MNTIDNIKETRTINSFDYDVKCLIIEKKIDIDNELFSKYINLETIVFQDCLITDFSKLNCSNNLKTLVCNNSCVSSLDGLEKFHELERLYLSGNRISDLSPLQGLNLIELDISNNPVDSLFAIKNHSRLEILKCSNTMIETLQDLHTIKTITRLECSNSRLKDINGINNCSRLKILDVSRQDIESITALSNLTELEEFNCSYNKVKNIQKLERCSSLKILNLKYNLIDSFEPISNLYLLKELYIIHNPVQDLRFIIYLNLETFDASESLINLNKQHIQVRRAIENIQTKTVRNINNNHQLIDNSMRLSIRNLFSDPEPSFYETKIEDSFMSDLAIELLKEYCSDKTLHHEYLSSFYELISYAWNRIITEPNISVMKNMFKDLEDVIIKPDFKFRSLRFYYVIQVLSKYFNDINLDFNENKCLAHTVLSIGTMVNPYHPFIHKKLVTDILTACCYDSSSLEKALDIIDNQ